MTIKHTPGPWKLKIMKGGRVRNLSYALDMEDNARLVELAPFAPHECDDPECPGNKNRLKLEAAEISWYEGFKAGYTQARAEEVK